MNKWIFAAAIAAIVTGAGAWAMRGPGIEAFPAKEQLGLMLDAHSTSKASAAEETFGKRLAAQTTRESNLSVGDADSFGRDVRWLGTLSGGGIKMADCTPLEGEPPDPFCMQVDPASTSTQFAEYRDMAHITLPAHSTTSLLCHWLSPTMMVTLSNESGIDHRVARLVVSPSFTFENAALNDPNLIDPDTGLPLQGKLEVYINTAQISALLDNGEQLPQRFSNSRTCVGGFVTRQTLQTFYGLSAAQSAQFFRNPTTVRLNLQVYADHVRSGFVTYGARFVGD